VAACSSDEAVPVPTGDGGPGGAGATGTGGRATGGKASTGGRAGGGAGGTGGASGSGGASGGTAGAGGTDAGDAAAPDPICGTKTQIQCGEYIVKHIDACGDCHSPRKQDGSIDMNFFLAGNPQFADLDPSDTSKGLVPTPNLTILKKNNWTAADVKNAFLNGQRSASRNGPIFPIMPYQNFHNMKPEHADAIAAYILSLTEIPNAIPPRQILPPPFNTFAAAIAPVDATKIPNTTLAATDANYEKAQLGKYLAGELGICIECHTTRTGPTLALDSTKFFAGGETFQIGGPFGTVTSENITPAANGIAGYVAADVVKVLSQGLNKANQPICPPMPVGPNGAFGGMEAAHMEAIGAYLTTIAPNVNPGDGGRFPKCIPPGPPPGDGGSPDASTPDSSTPDSSTPTDSGNGPG
jgi:hypothetical protein